MWKVVIGSLIFAALALFILNKAGGDIDLGGEKHEVAPGADNPRPAGSAPAASAARLQ